MVDVPATPVLATVAGVEIASVGFWNLSNAQDWHPSAADLAAAVAALDCPAVRRPVLKFGHTGEPGQGDPSIGLVDNMRLTDDGQTLIGDFVGVPAWLAAADEQGRSVIAAAYPDRSGEFERDYVCQLGHTHPFVVHAVALLGVVRPGIGTLQSLYDLYTRAPDKETSMAQAAITLAATTIDDVRRAYYDGPGANWALWIREMFIDPAELIVQNDEDDTLQRVPYTLGGSDGEVGFGDPQPVKVEYVNARAAVQTPAMAFASHAEARPVALKMKNPLPAQAEVNKGKEGAMPTLKEGLAQKLGIPADADDETALAALDEALAERAGDNDEHTHDDDAGTAGGAGTPTQEPNPPGVVQLDQTQYNDLVAAAADGRAARAQQIREDNERIVSAAISDGRIPPARKQHWLDYLERDRDGGKQALASLKPGLVPMAEVGHAVGAETTEDDQLYTSLFGKDA